MNQHPGKVLQSLAKRISSLDNLAPQQTTPVNFAFGAICALAWAEKFGYPQQRSYKNRSYRISKAMRKEAERFAISGVPPKEGEWLGGYYYNDAIVRIDVAFEHIMRDATNCHKHENFRKLKSAAEDIHCPKQFLDSWGELHNEVRRLKHANRRFIDGPLVSYRTAVHAVRNLVDCIEWRLDLGKGSASQKPSAVTTAFS